jgi:hypothetical protein
MYTESFRNQLTTTLEELKAEGLFKSERIIASPQGAEIINAGENYSFKKIIVYLRSSAEDLEIIQF